MNEATKKARKPTVP